MSGFLLDKTGPLKAPIHLADPTALLPHPEGEPNVLARSKELLTLCMNHLVFEEFHETFRDTYLQHLNEKFRKPLEVYLNRWMREFKKR